jgi:MFS family permease
MSAGPAWNVWVEQLVPKPIRARFFSQRTWASQIGILAGLLGGGAALQWFARGGHAVTGFAALFLVAAGCRLWSSRLLSRQSEPRPPGEEEIQLGLRDLFQRIRRGAGGRLLLTLVLLTGAVAIVSPFFTPYMLVQLHLSYTQYMLLIGISFGAKILTLPGLGKLASRLGATLLLRTGAAGVVAIPFLWLVSTDFTYLLGVQILGGASWASLELAFFLLLFEAIPSAERTSLLVAYNLANAVALVGGSLLGSVLFEGVGMGATGYRTLFLVSGAARIVASLLLLRGLGLRGKGIRLVMRSIALRPSAGSLGRPILGALRPRPPGSS